MGIWKPKSSAPIGAWHPAPPRSQPVQMFSTAACWLQTSYHLHSMNDVRRARKAVNLGVRAPVRRSLVRCDGVALRDAFWSLRESSFVSDNKP
eukprot:2081550-Pleurochrysis_carterae.AAC.1